MGECGGEVSVCMQWDLVRRYLYRVWEVDEKRHLHGALWTLLLTTAHALAQALPQYQVLTQTQAMTLTMTLALLQTPIQVPIQVLIHAWAQALI